MDNTQRPIKGRMFIAAVLGYPIRSIRILMWINLWMWVDIIDDNIVEGKRSAIIGELFHQQRLIPVFINHPKDKKKRAKNTKI